MSDKCQWCGHMHGPRCPQVKSFEYHENGTLKRVEFVTDADRPAVHHHDHTTRSRVIERELSDADKERIAREYMRRIRS